MKFKMISYWVITAFLLFNVLAGAIAELTQRKENVEGMLLLGYPVYFMLIIAVWKILGTMAVLAPGFPRLKEWAYAGIFFNMTGAAVSHAVVGDATWHVFYTGFLAALTIASWALRPPSRTLGVLFHANSMFPSTTDYKSA
ncbi:MAG: DoxX family protein [Anaerolineae bacterium]